MDFAYQRCHHREGFAKRSRVLCAQPFAEVEMGGWQCTAGCQNRDLPSKMENLHWNESHYYTQQIFLLSWCLIKIPPRFTESRFQPASQTSHRRQIGNEFTQGIGGRKAGFGEFWGTWGIEHIRNDEDREEWLSTNWLLKVFFEFYMFPSFRLNVSWSLLPVLFLHSGCYWVKSGYSSVAPIPSNNYDYVTDLLVPWELMNKNMVPVVALMLLKFREKNLTSPDQGSFLVLVIGGR